MRTLPIEPLSREAFAPFGDVIEASDAVRHFPINGGNTERYHDLMKIEVDEAGRPIVSIFRGQPRALPFDVAMLERHPLGSQCFIPLSGHRYLVAVAPAGPAPDPAAVRVFLARGDQGVNYGRGVWHHPLLALDKAADFLVIDRSGPGNNCDEHFFAEPMQIGTVD